MGVENSPRSGRAISHGVGPLVPLSGLVMAPIRAMNQIGQFKWTPKKSAETVTDPETAGGSEKRLDRPRLTPTGQRLDSFGLKVD